jgi:hypothetical protein
VKFYLQVQVIWRFGVLCRVKIWTLTRLVGSIHCVELDCWDKLIFKVLGIVRRSDTGWATAESRSSKCGVFDSRFGLRTKQSAHANGLIGVTRKGVWLFFVLLYPECSPQRLKSNFTRHVTYFPPLPACKQINVNKESSLMSINLSSQFSQFDLLLPDP